MFRTGGKIDQGSYSKLKGRLFSIIAMPIVLGIGATFLGNLLDITADSDRISGNFSRYLVDDRAWAYNFNFAPNGDDGKDGNINPSSGSSYVDLKYNPYTGNGADRIKQINSKSSLANNDKGNIFPNSALALSFGASDSFSAVDFINYKGTAASMNYYGRGDGDGEVFGSYYKYAENMKKAGTLGDVDQSYYPSGEVRDPKLDSGKTAQKGGYSEAINDYKSGDDLTVSPQIAWRDRYIYGAKSAGENIDKYYSEPPSLEQMENKVGTNKEAAFSNQSMFLILSTRFNETGGKYYIDAPARGIMQAKASFDSNRSNFYVVSMVGNPLYTLFGLIAKPIIQLVIMLAVATAVLSLGLIEMNTKPLMAWIKGMTLGNIEYAQAFIVYCVGIGGTILSLVVIPPLLGMLLEGVSKLILLPAEFIDKNAISPQASIALHGTPLVFEAILSILFVVLYIKSPSFRAKLIELFTLAWAWAKTTGERIEYQASGGAGMRVKQESQRMVARNKLNQAMNAANAAQNPTSRFGAVKKWLSDTAGDVKRDLNIPSYDFSQDTASEDSGSGFADPDKTKLQDAGTIAQNGMYERAMNSLKENELDRELPNNVQMASIEAQEGIAQFRKNPTQENYVTAHDKIDLLEREMSEGDYGPEKEARVANAREELDNLSKSHNISDPDSIKFTNSIRFQDRNAAIYDSAVDGLKEIELDRELPNNVQIASVQAQNAMQEFKEMPTQETFVEAQDKLNVLHSEITEQDYGQEKEARVIQAKEELYNMSQMYNITDAPPIEEPSMASGKSSADLQKGLTNIQQSLRHLKVGERDSFNANNQSLTHSKFEERDRVSANNQSQTYSKFEERDRVSVNNQSQTHLKVEEKGSVNVNNQSQTPLKVGDKDRVNVNNRSLTHLKVKERDSADDEQLSRSLDRMLEMNNKNEE